MLDTLLHPLLKAVLCQNTPNTDWLTNLAPARHRARGSHMRLYSPPMFFAAAPTRRPSINQLLVYLLILKYVLKILHPEKKPGPIMEVAEDGRDANKT